MLAVGVEPVEFKNQPASVVVVVGVTGIDAFEEIAAYRPEVVEVMVRLLFRIGPLFEKLTRTRDQLLQLQLDVMAPAEEKGVGEQVKLGPVWAATRDRLGQDPCGRLERGRPDALLALSPSEIDGRGAVRARATECVGCAGPADVK